MYISLFLNIIGVHARTHRMHEAVKLHMIAFQSPRFLRNLMVDPYSSLFIKNELVSCVKFVQILIYADDYSKLLSNMRSSDNAVVLQNFG